MNRGKAWILPVVVAALVIAGVGMVIGTAQIADPVPPQSSPAPIAVVEEQRSPLQFEDTDGVSRTFGYVSQAKTPKGRYSFTSHTLSEAEKLVEQVEYIAEEAGKLGFNTRSSGLTVYFRNNSEAGMGRTLHDVSFSLLDASESGPAGALVSYLSGYKLPAWLSAGLELNWKAEIAAEQEGEEAEQAGGGGLEAWRRMTSAAGGPGFGDYWLTPYLAEPEVMEAAEQTAADFTAYMKQEQTLSEIVGLFAEGKQEEAYGLVAREWRFFAGDSGDQPDASHFYNYEARGYAFEIASEHAQYRFAGNLWDADRVAEFLEYSDRAVVFAQQWTGVSFEERPRILLAPDHNRAVQASGFAGGWIHVYGVQEYGAALTVRYVTQELLLKLEPRNMIEPLNDGALQTVTLEFETKRLAEGQKAYYYDAISYFMKKEWLHSDPTGFIGRYNRFAAQPYEDNGPVDLKAYALASALAFYDNEKDQELYRYLGYQPSGEYYVEELNGIGVGDAFVIYLLDLHGKDDFLKVYADLDLFEDVYGATLEEAAQAFKASLRER